MIKRSQKVTYQYNAAGNINFGMVQNQANFVQELEKLMDEISQASEAQVISRESSTEAQYQVQKTINQAKNSNSDKSAMISYLEKAKSTLKGIAQASGILGGLARAVELAEKLF